MAKTFKPESGSRQNFNSLFARLSALEAGHTRLMDRVTQLYTELFTQQETIAAIRTHENEDRAALVALANAGAKNLLKFREDVTSSSAGNVYARINFDGTLSVGLTSGTTATAQLVFTLGPITNYRDRKLILSGCPAGGNYQSGYALYISNDGSTAQADTGSGATLPIITGVTSSVVALMVRSGTTISSELTFRPMVRDASIVDSTFVPYAPTNRELYEMIQALQSGSASTLSLQPTVMSAAKSETQEQEQREEETDA